MKENLKFRLSDWKVRNRKCYNFQTIDQIYWLSVKTRLKRSARYYTKDTRIDAKRISRSKDYLNPAWKLFQWRHRYAMLPPPFTYSHTLVDNHRAHAPLRTTTERSQGHRYHYFPFLTFSCLYFNRFKYQQKYFSCLF